MRCYCKKVFWIAIAVLLLANGLLLLTYENDTYSDVHEETSKVFPPENLQMALRFSLIAATSQRPFTQAATCTTYPLTANISCQATDAPCFGSVDCDGCILPPRFESSFDSVQEMRIDVNVTHWALQNNVTNPVAVQVSAVPRVYCTKNYYDNYHTKLNALDPQGSALYLRSGISVTAWLGLPFWTDLRALRGESKALGGGSGGLGESHPRYILHSIPIYETTDSRPGYFSMRMSSQHISFTSTVNTRHFILHYPWFPFSYFVALFAALSTIAVLIFTDRPCETNDSCCSCGRANNSAYSSDRVTDAASSYLYAPSP